MRSVLPGVALTSSSAS